jgi:RNA polymerase sigma-70 factor (ECF subfamily)
MSEPLSDFELIAGLAKGDKRAMPMLFARHRTRVFRFILRRVRSEALAEELVNETFLAVWQQAARFEGNSSATTWMLSIAHNKAVSSLRKKRDEALDEDAAAEIADLSDSAETTLAKSDKGSALRACLNKLPEDQRVVMDLVYYHEQSVKEVAEVLGIPENTVKTRMFYARKKLSDLLKAAGIDRGWP